MLPITSSKESLCCLHASSFIVIPLNNCGISLQFFWIPELDLGSLSVVKWNINPSKMLLDHWSFQHLLISGVEMLLRSWKLLFNFMEHQPIVILRCSLMLQNWKAFNFFLLNRRIYLPFNRQCPEESEKTINQNFLWNFLHC